MKLEKRRSRTVGVLLLLHLIIGLMLPFILIDRIRQPAGLFAGATGNAGLLRASIMLLFVGSAIPIAIASTAWPVLRRPGSAMRLWLFAFAAIGFTLQVVDNGALLSTLTLSQEYIKAGTAKLEVAQSIGIVISAIRKWTHFTYLLVAVSWIAILCGTFYHFRLVPRALAMLGLVTSVLQIYGVSLRVVYGFAPEMRLAMPLAPAYFALAVWLIVKGFNEDQIALRSAGYDPGVVRA
ncbi:MAG: DUF4386 domain-containing protein [Acidobacteriaceae bacterium]